MFVCYYGNSYTKLEPFLATLAASSAKATSPSMPTKKTNTRSPKNSAEGDLQRYIRALMESHGFIRFVEMPNMEEISDVPILDLFVEPGLTTEEVRADRPMNLWPKRQKLATVLGDNNRLILLGDPGSGKSTLISSLTYQHCVALVKQEIYNAEDVESDIPIPIILRELTLRSDLTWEKLLDEFALHRTGKLLGTRAKIEELLRRGKALLMLDGLESVP
jgi:predicted NACHT family NTPase